MKLIDIWRALDDHGVRYRSHCNVSGGSILLLEGMAEVYARHGQQTQWRWLGEGKEESVVIESIDHLRQLVTDHLRFTDEKGEP